MKSKKQKDSIPDRSRPGLPTTALSTSPRSGSDKCATGVPHSIKLARERTTIGTWNVRTLYACGKVKELTHELQHYRWDVIGLSEVRWTNFGEMRTDEGHKIWFSGDDTKHQHGVAFIVRKEILSSVISCTPSSSRLISIRIAAKPQNISIIQVYAPTSDYEDEEVEAFYEQLDRLLKGIPKKDVTVVMGDWNAKVGPDAYQHWAGTVGKFGWGETNDRGLRLLEFAKSNRLTLANTLHPQKKSRTVTWRSPNSRIQNQIDYILVPQRFKSSINKAKTRAFPGAEVGSDHNLVLTSLKLKLKTQRPTKSTRIRFDLDRLKDSNVAEEFRATVGGKFAVLTLLHEDVDAMADNVRDVLFTSAEEVLGKRRRKKQPWVTSDILDMCDERRVLKKDKNKDLESASKYRIANNNIRKAMKKAKEEWIERQCDDIEESFSTGNTKKAYDTLKSLTKTQQPKSSVIEDSNGQLLTESNAVLGRWTKYCKDLYNYPLQPDSSIVQNACAKNREPEDLPIMQEEVKEAVRSLKAGKSPGIDNIPGELLKYGGEELTGILTKLCQKIWETKQWPKQWTQSLVLPLPKKGNLRLCQNYRTISLISHPSKILLRIILNRLKTAAEQLLAEEQAGFRAGRSTVEQIFNCRVLMEKHLEHQRSLLHNFIDFRKAFDRVWHEGLWHVMRNYGIEEGLIQTIEALYANSSSAVLLDNQIGESFLTTVGVRQGCLLSPVLFNIFLEQILTESLHGHHSSISINGRPICNLRFADDIDLMAGTEQELQELTNRLTDRAGAYGMEVSTEKSKVMVNNTTITSANIYMNGQKLEEVGTFKYLWATLSKDGGSTKEIKTRIALATAAMARLSRIWRGKTISFSTKFRLYKSLVVSILLYGCESWTLLADTEKRLQAFENKCMRKMLQISYTEHRTNADVWNSVTLRVGRQEPLLATVKRRKMAWFGHTIRHNTLSKTILQGTVEGSRRQGRPRKSWMENVKEWTNQTMPELLAAAPQRKKWHQMAAAAALLPPPRPRRSRDQK